MQRICTTTLAAYPSFPLRLIHVCNRFASLCAINPAGVADYRPLWDNDRHRIAEETSATSVTRAARYGTPHTRAVELSRALSFLLSIDSANPLSRRLVLSFTISRIDTSRNSAARLATTPTTTTTGAKIDRTTVVRGPIVGHERATVFQVEPST